MARKHIIKETQRFLKGKNLSIQWLLYESDGNIHNLENKELEVYMTCGGYKYPVKVYTVTENAIAWTFLAEMQTKTGYYKLVLKESDPVNGLYSYDVHEAFALVSGEDLENYDNVIAEDGVLRVTSVLTYAHITNIATVDTVSSDAGTVAVVHLTNGKTFNLPLGGGSGGGGSYTLLPATATRLGGLKTGFTRDGDKYPVMLDQNANAYVEVPESGGAVALDTLYSNSREDALSANMGRVLREMIEALPSGGGEGGGTGIAINYVYYIDDEYPVITYGPNRPGRVRPTYIHLQAGSQYWSQNPQEGYLVVHLPGDGKMSIYGGCYYDEENDEYICTSLLLYKYLLFDPEQGGGGTEPGLPGRSITSVQHWFKLTADESVQAPPMNVDDPSSSAGGSWSLTAGTPTVQYPYLRCFMQVNYDQPLASGYTYTRSSAFTARYFNSDSSADYSRLVEALASLRTELFNDLANYDTAIAALNEALEGLRSKIPEGIANQLNNLRDRLAQIDGSDVALIRDNSQGLWGVLTSWQSASGNKKAFADIIANAQNAQIILQTGSTFFDHIVGGEFTLDGLIGKIALAVSRADMTSYVNAQIASAQFSVDPSSLNSVISKSQACWRKNGILYPYDLYLTDYMTDHSSATLADYETYMTSAPADDGPSGDSTRPAGPFELVVVVEQFSAIKQTMDEISASVDTTKYMWENVGTISSARPPYASYNAFQTNWENRSQSYISYTYEQYVTNVLLYRRVEVGAALSNITQTSDEIRSIIGDMGYFWRKAASGGGYTYERYAVPPNETRDAYVARMENDGWIRVTFASRMSVIDQFPDSITALVKKSTLCWLDESATGAAYCRDYDYWMGAYNLYVISFINPSPGDILDYEDWVIENHPSYELKVVTNNFSRIKQEADRITSAVTELDGYDARMSSIEQRSDEISLSVSNGQYCWVDNTDEILHRYDYFMDDYEVYKESAVNPLDYEDWVVNTKNCTRSDAFEEVSGIKLRSDEIWMGVGDGDELKASIEILAGLGTDGGKIVLTGEEVKVDGTLAAGIVNAGLVNVDGGIFVGKINAEANDPNGERIDGTVILPESITTSKIAANSITADRIHSGVLEAAFATIFNQLTVGEYSKIVFEDGLMKVYDENDLIWLEIGKGPNDNTPVIKVYGQYDNQNNWVPLYDLGPDGIKQFDSYVAMPKWPAVRFWKQSSLTEGGSYVQDRSTAQSTNVIYLFKYEDGMKVVWLGSAQGVQYYDPETGDYSSSNSKYHNHYFAAANFGVPDDGYYVIDNVLWEKSSATAGRATALRIATVNGVKKYYYGHIDLTNIDQNAGTTGTISEVKINSELVL